MPDFILKRIKDERFQIWDIIFKDERQSKHKYINESEQDEESTKQVQLLTLDQFLEIDQYIFSEEEKIEDAFEDDKDGEENKAEDENEEDEVEETAEFKWFEEGEWDKTYLAFYNYSGETIKKGE